MRLSLAFVLQLAATAAVLPSIYAQGDVPSISVEAEVAAPSMANLLERITALNNKAIVQNTIPEELKPAKRDGLLDTIKRSLGLAHEERSSDDEEEVDAAGRAAVFEVDAAVEEDTHLEERTFHNPHNATIAVESHGHVTSNHTSHSTGSHRPFGHDSHHGGSRHRRQEPAAPVEPVKVAKIAKVQPSPASVPPAVAKVAKLPASSVAPQSGKIRKVVPLKSSSSVAAPAQVASVTDDVVIGAPPLDIPSGGVKVVTDPKAWTMPGGNKPTPAAMNGIVKKRQAQPTSVPPLVAALQSLASVASVASVNSTMSAAADEALAAANEPAELPEGVLTVPVAPVQVVTDPADVGIAGVGPKATPNAMVGIVKRQSKIPKSRPSPIVAPPANNVQVKVPLGVKPTPNAMAGIVKRADAKIAKIRPASSSSAASVTPIKASASIASVQSIITAPSSPVKVVTTPPTGALKPTPNAMVGIVKRVFIEPDYVGQGLDDEDEHPYAIYPDEEPLDEEDEALDEQEDWLEKRGEADEAVDAAEELTKRGEEDYDDFLERVKRTDNEKRAHIEYGYGERVHGVHNAEKGRVFGEHHATRVVLPSSASFSTSTSAKSPHHQEHKVRPVQHHESISESHAPRPSSNADHHRSGKLRPIPVVAPSQQSTSTHMSKKPKQRSSSASSESAHPSASSSASAVEVDKVAPQHAGVNKIAHNNGWFAGWFRE